MGTVETYEDIRKRADRFARLAMVMAAVGVIEAERAMQPVVQRVRLPAELDC